MKEVLLRYFGEFVLDPQGWTSRESAVLLRVYINIAGKLCH